MGRFAPIEAQRTQYDQAVRDSRPTRADMLQSDEAAIRAQQIIAQEQAKSGPGLPPLEARLRQRGITPDTLQQTRPDSRTPFLDTRLKRVLRHTKPLRA